jgi:signal transduction histidine kinase
MARNTLESLIGLALVKHIVQAHGGDVEVRPAVARGAVFVVTLPVCRSRAGQAAADQVPPPAEPGAA